MYNQLLFDQESRKTYISWLLFVSLMSVLCNSRTWPFLLDLSTSQYNMMTLNTAGVWGTVSPPVGPGQSPGVGAGGKTTGSSENLAFYSIKKDAYNRAKSTIILWCIFTSPVNVCNTSYEF